MSTLPLGARRPAVRMMVIGIMTTVTHSEHASTSFCAKRVLISQMMRMKGKARTEGGEESASTTRVRISWLCSEKDGIRHGITAKPGIEKSEKEASSSRYSKK